MTVSSILYSRASLFIACTLSLSVHACRSNEEKSSTSLTPSAPLSRKAPPPQRPLPQSASAGASDTLLKTTHIPPPTILIELNESAYGNRVEVDGDTVYLLTPSAAYRFAPGVPSVKQTLNLGHLAALTSRAIIYWSQGHLYSISKTVLQSAQKVRPRSLAPVPRRPVELIASTDRFAWLARDDATHHSIHTLRTNEIQRLYQTTRKITSLVLLQDWVFFVEQESATSWRIGAVPVGGSQPATFGPEHHGRAPAMLASSNNAIYFFDLPSRSIRRVAADFSSETTIAQQLVCSPLAVSAQVLCSRVEGVFHLPLDGGAVQVLTKDPLGLVTSIAASNQRTAWLNDSGQNKSTLRTLALP